MQLFSSLNGGGFIDKVQKMRDTKFAKFTKLCCRPNETKLI